MPLLYEHPLSSYAQKVKIALREKGVPFAAELPEAFGTGRADGPLAAANPRAEIPVLIDGEARMAEAATTLITGGRRREYHDHRLERMVRSGGIEVVLAGLRDGTIRFSWPAAPL